MVTKKIGIAQTAIAIYASDIGLLAKYYKEALNLEVLEKSADFICIGKSEIEINILKMNGKPGNIIEPEKVFAIREETPLKCSFIVDSFEKVKEAAKKYGGGLKDESESWDWRGTKHLDGYDPEGNVVQFRVLNN